MRGVRIGEEDRATQIPCQVGVAGEFLAIVQGHRLDLVRVHAQAAPELAPDHPGRAARELGHPQKARAPLHRRQARAPLALADQGVALPVTHLAARLG